MHSTPAKVLGSPCHCTRVCSARYGMTQDTTGCAFSPGWSRWLLTEAYLDVVTKGAARVFTRHWLSTDWAAGEGWEARQRREREERHGGRDRGRVAARSPLLTLGERGRGREPPGDAYVRGHGQGLSLSPSYTLRHPLHTCLEVPHMPLHTSKPALTRLY
ncbi:hypothetical protein E2C01_065658 [Portunus trituberculatus]|uniref:Uncharacterized protein n=1 Tax=Portunus trituberculatus TaxID=210409 RepID=A0A5B7HF54_PORTR|nr:hypothetical protein [Portunus trituberculatus]